MKIRIQYLLFIWLFLALPAAAQTYYFFTNFDGSIWKYTTNGATATIANYAGAGGAIQVPNNVDGNTVIALAGGGASVFPVSVTSVGIPPGVIDIGDYVFDLDAGLTNVVIPNGVTHIGYLAFQQTGLVTVNIPNTVLIMEDGAFNNCVSLKSVNIGNGLTRIGVNAFNSCTNLGSVAIPNSVTLIDTAAFENCKSLTNLSFGNSITNIGNSAFQGCVKLTNVVIPNTVRSIGTFAFFGCSGLASVIIGGSLTNVGGSAFNTCTNLKSAFFLGNAPSNDATIFLGDGLATVYYMPGTTGWPTNFGGRPTMLWNPQASAPGVNGGQFRFTITGPTNAVIVVQACTNLANPAWLPISTNTLTGGTSPFTDPQWGCFAMRFYRFSAQ